MTSYNIDFNLDGQWLFDTAADPTKQFTYPNDVDLFDQDIDGLGLDPHIEAASLNFPDLSAVKSSTPSHNHEPSAFTFSSASEYESLYAESVSNYNPIDSPPSEYSVHSFAQEFLNEVDLDMHRLGIHSPDPNNGYMPSPGSDTSSPGSLSLASFSPATFSRGSFSDYEPAAVGHARIRSSASDYYPEASRYTQSVISQGTVSLAHVSAQLPGSPPSSPYNDQTLEQGDPKKKYHCTVCHRAFARQFNLKTHIQTHDPNRAKPHACGHKGCGRAFSRKHDLMRHVTSIHRSGTPSSDTSIGVGSSPRSRCEECGKSAVGEDKETGCDCVNIK